MHVWGIRCTTHTNTGHAFKIVLFTPPAHIAQKFRMLLPLSHFLSEAGSLADLIYFHHFLSNFIFLLLRDFHDLSFRALVRDYFSLVSLYYIIFDAADIIIIRLLG